MEKRLGIEVHNRGNQFTLQGNDAAIEGATVRLIKLLDADAIETLIEKKKIPDGEGGEKDIIRIKQDKVHDYSADYEVKTDASGKFAVEADLQAYLVYTFGPGAAPDVYPDQR